MTVLSLLLATVAFAADPCGQTADDGQAHACVVRELTLPATAALTVDARENGGITVTGTDTGGIRVVAKISANAGTQAQAQALADGVKVVTSDGKIGASGPAAGRNQGWSVSFEVAVPRHTDLSLITHNGGLAVTGVDARVALTSTNGGIALEDVNGEITGSTTNGGVDVQLSGSGWRGAGLDIETTNGGISVVLPRTYAADLDVGTLHGGVSVEAPNERHNGRVTASLGGGGAPIHLTTTNGGVSVAAQ